MSNCDRKEFLNPYDPSNLPAAPSLMQPEDGTFSLQNPPYFQWELVEDTLNPLYGEQLVFCLQITSDEGFNSIDFENDIITSYALVPDFNANEGKYYWRVRVKYIDEAWSDWSETRSFSVRFPVIGSCDVRYHSDMAVVQNYVFLSYVSNELKIIDISDPTNPVLLTTYTDPSTTFCCIFASFQYLYTTNSMPVSEGFSVYDIANPAYPELLGRIYLSNYDPGEHWVENGKAYICCYDNYTPVVDVSNPESLFIESTIPIYGKKIIVEQDYAFILYDQTLWVVDVTDNSYVSSVDLDFPTHSFTIFGDYLSVTGSYHTRIYNITNPYNISFISEIAKGGNDITMHDNFLFLAISHDHAINIYDITDKASPVWLGSVINTFGKLLTNGQVLFCTKPRFSVIKYE